LIVHVEEPPMAYGGGELYYGALEPTRNELSKMLEAVRPADPNVPCEHHLITGEPASELVRLAKAQHVDMIVMGTHGRTGILRLLMGSVAEAVVRRSDCPVLTYRESARKAANV
jgi:universal stress protein A